MYTQEFTPRMGQVRVLYHQELAFDGLAGSMLMNVAEVTHVCWMFLLTHPLRLTMTMYGVDPVHSPALCHIASACATVYFIDDATAIRFPLPALQNVIGTHLKTSKSSQEAPRTRGLRYTYMRKPPGRLTGM